MKNPQEYIESLPVMSSGRNYVCLQRSGEYKFNVADDSEDV
jgi:hypothetical protein